MTQPAPPGWFLEREVRRVHLPGARASQRLLRATASAFDVPGRNRTPLLIGVSSPLGTHGGTHGTEAGLAPERAILVLAPPLVVDDVPILGDAT
jgi:hypothetical protein